VSRQHGRVVPPGLSPGGPRTKRHRADHRVTPCGFWSRFPGNCRARLAKRWVQGASSRCDQLDDKTDADHERVEQAAYANAASTRESSTTDRTCRRGRWLALLSLGRVLFTYIPQPRPRLPPSAGVGYGPTTVMSAWLSNTWFSDASCPTICPFVESDSIVASTKRMPVETYGGGVYSSV
jgi:hypothetical protein